MAPMAFAGWPIEAVEFYEGLEADNSKVYWTEHKAVYDRHVKAPMDELLAELPPPPPVAQPTNDRDALRDDDLSDLP